NVGLNAHSDHSRSQSRQRLYVGRYCTRFGFDGRDISHAFVSMGASNKVTLLIVDDQRDVRESLGLLLSGEGYAVETAASPAEVRAALARRRYDAVFLDLNFQADTTSGREGLALLADIREREPDLPVIVLT